MLLATILFLCPIPQSGYTIKVGSDLTTVVTRDSTKVSSLSQPLPSAPEPKVAADASSDTAEAPNFPAPVFAMPEVTATAIAVPIEPRVTSTALKPVKPAVSRPYETSIQRKLWYALAFTGHGAAVFDAWSTRRAISSGFATEANPMLRPFSHSSAMYAATQVSPLVMDLVAKKMMVSQHGLIRKMWWLPQAAGSGFSVAAGVHNMGLIPR